MKLIELQQYFKKQKFFSVKEIKLVFGARYKNNLLLWKKKGYITQISKGRYYFTDKEIKQIDIYNIANNIYKPSYISLELALNIYNIIPEGVYTITSISSKKTKIIKSKLAFFNYRSIKTKYFFGYNFITKYKSNYKIATLEKAIIDYIYLNTQLKTKTDFYELRRNIDELNTQIDIKRLQKFLKVYNQKSFHKRMQIFISFIHSDDRHYNY